MPCLRSSLLRAALLAAAVTTMIAAPAPGQQTSRSRGQSPSALDGQVASLDVADLPRLVHFSDLRALRAFFERVDVSTVDDGLSRPTSSTPLSMDAVLGRLPSDWGAPFAFVQGAINYVPYSGTLRGARGTLESGGGNALDQSLLLRALLQARGVRTRLARGRLQWAEAARLAVGTSTPPAPRDDDPWPRWLETAADHWWVQAQHDGEWIDLDPSFVDAGAGQAMGTVSETYDAVPEEWISSVRVELRRGDLTVAEASLPADMVVGQTIALAFAAQSQAAVALWQASETAVTEVGENLGGILRGIGWLPLRPSRAERTVSAVAGDRAGAVPRTPRPRRPSALQRIALDPDAGPWVAQLEIPGRTLTAGPFDHADLDSLLVRVTVRAPRAAEHVLIAPWGGGPGGRLSIAVGAGRVSDARLVSEAGPLYDSVNRLATLEQQARGDMRPPIAYGDAVETLAAAARAGWETFARRAPETLAWAVLQAIDRVAERGRAARVIRQSLRLAAVRWRPAESGNSSALEIRISDPVTIGQLQGESAAASLRAANGVLQSAVLSQILNRVAERAPETAFDVTLRAIGTRRSISVYSGDEGLPAEWPAVARAEAAVGLRAGYAVLAPGAFDAGVAGWWHVGIFDGEMLGWVPGVQAPLHGRVDVAAPPMQGDLDSLLASLPSLHRALRWLADMPGTGAMSLSSVPVAACSSAAVAADAMRASVPAAWPSPDVPALCGSR